MSKIIVFFVAISLSAVTVVADFFTKKASLFDPVWNKWLLAGAVIYGLTAVGWVFTMRNAKLSTLGVIYGVSCIIMLTFISVYFFNEKLSMCISYTHYTFYDTSEISKQGLNGIAGVNLNYEFSFITPGIAFDIGFGNQTDYSTIVDFSKRI